MGAVGRQDPWTGASNDIGTSNRRATPRCSRPVGRSFFPRLAWTDISLGAKPGSGPRRGPAGQSERHRCDRRNQLGDHRQCGPHGRDRRDPPHQDFGARRRPVGRPAIPAIHRGHADTRDRGLYREARRHQGPGRSGEHPDPRCCHRPRRRLYARCQGQDRALSRRRRRRHAGADLAPGRDGWGLLRPLQRPQCVSAELAGDQLDDRHHRAEGACAACRGLWRADGAQGDHRRDHHASRHRLSSGSPDDAGGQRDLAIRPRPAHRHHHLRQL